MNQEQTNLSRSEVILRNVRYFSACQSTPECRENYFRSCEAHGGEIAEIVNTVRTEYINNTIHETQNTMPSA